MKRRTFLKGTLAASFIPTVITRNLHAHDQVPHAVWVENAEPEQLLNESLKVFGGMSAFISPGEVVVVKPNIGWDRAPQFAATTNPDLIKAIVRSCYEAGAKKVLVFDHTCNNPRRCYKNSKIAELAESVDAEVIQVRKNRYENLTIADGKLIDQWPIYQDYLEADKIINVPIAKHHSLCRVTLGMKNLMGVMGGNRGSLHSDFDIKLIDIVSKIMPDLTIIDGYRILTSNGPVGGNVDDVVLKRTLIVSPCLVSADYLALDLFNLDVKEVGYLKEALARGISKYDVKRLQVQRINLA